MRVNVLPCTDILWAYMQREGSEEGSQKQLPVNNLFVVTRRHKRYQFDMSEREVRECLRLLRALNPEIAIGFPKGGRINQKNLPNTRDLGALATEDGRHIIPRKLLRSGHLYHCSLWDQDTLKDSYRLSTVIDLRNRVERSRMPDTIIEGVTYHHVPILEDKTPGITAENGILEILMDFRGDPKELMCTQYRNVVRDQVAKKHFANFLDILIRQEEGAVLFHDTYGTARVGMATALLLCALGVPGDVIREEYMKSNQYLEKEEECLIRFLESRTIVDERIIDNVKFLFEAKDMYLESFFKEIEKEYETVDRFLKKELYLTPKSLEILKDKYLI
jgi:protein-tyrosine phosphatase